MHTKLLEVIMLSDISFTISTISTLNFIYFSAYFLLLIQQMFYVIGNSKLKAQRKWELKINLKIGTK